MSEPTLSNTTNETNETLMLELINKFAKADACWYSSVRPATRVHLAPIWHVWHAQSVYIVTRATSVRAKNLQFSNSVSLALPDPMNVLILEGIASSANEMRSDVQPLFQTKYNWDIISDTSYQLVIRVTPTKLIAWGDHGNGRWQFDSHRGSWSSLS